MASPEVQKTPVEKEEGPPKNSLMGLEEETLLEVFSQLDLVSARRLGATCRRLHRISQDPQMGGYASVGLLSVRVGPAGEVTLRTDLGRPAVVRLPDAAADAESQKAARLAQGDLVGRLLEEMVGRGLVATMLEVEGDGTGRWDWLFRRLLRLLPPLVGLRVRGLKGPRKSAKAHLLKHAATLRLLDTHVDYTHSPFGKLMDTFRGQDPNKSAEENFCRARSCLITQLPKQQGYESGEDDNQDFIEQEFGHIPKTDRPMLVHLGPGMTAFLAGDFRLSDLPAPFDHPYYAYLSYCIKSKMGESLEAPPQKPGDELDPAGLKAQGFLLFGSPGEAPLAVFGPRFPDTSVEPAKRRKEGKSESPDLRLLQLRHPGVEVGQGDDHCNFKMLCGGLNVAGEPVPAVYVVNWYLKLPSLRMSLTRLKRLPEARWGHSVALVPDPDPAAHRSFRLVLGGAKDSAATSILDEVLCHYCRDFETGEKEHWARLQPMTTPRAHFAMGVEGGRVFVAGGLGEDGRPTDAAEVFDFAAGVWAALPDLPLAVQGTAGLVHGGRFWVCGGRDAEGKTSTQLVSLDLSGAAQGQWGQWDVGRAGMGRPRAFHALAALQDDRLMAIGGEEDLTDAEVYDPASDAWTGTGLTAKSQAGMNAFRMH